MPERQTQLNREDILTGLEKVNAYLEKEGVRGEMCIFGGACMCLAFAARNTTKDIDAVFEPAAVVRKAAFAVANELGWSWDWLNDDVKGFLSTQTSDGTMLLEACDFSHLSVHAAKPEYLLAMKCLAARSGNEDGISVDLQDAVWLCQHLKITKRDEIVKIILSYFPDKTPPERTDFFICEILSQLDT